MFQLFLQTRSAAKLLIRLSSRCSALRKPQLIDWIVWGSSDAGTLSVCCAIICLHLVTLPTALLGPDILP